MYFRFGIDRREHEWEISDWTEIVNMWMKNVFITVAWQDVWTRSKDWWYEKNIHKDQSLWLWTTKVSFASIQINLPLFHVNWRLKHMQLLSRAPSEAEQRSGSLRVSILSFSNTDCLYFLSNCMLAHLVQWFRNLALMRF